MFGSDKSGKESSEKTKTTGSKAKSPVVADWPVGTLTQRPHHQGGIGPGDSTEEPRTGEGTTAETGEPGTGNEEVTGTGWIKGTAA